MTLSQQIAYIGSSAFTALPQFKLPHITSSDGIDGETTSTALGNVYPSGISLAATWDAQMAANRGRQNGLDARTGGTQLLNGPGMNMYRMPHSGREAEYLAGEDPILGAVLGTAFVEGEQSTGVMSELKHVVTYDQESNRAFINNNVRERALHEIYEIPFEAAIKIAQPAAVMCAFVMVNGVHSCENSPLETKLIRTQWGFQGLIQSDFGAIFDVGPLLAAGTDWDGSGGYGYSESAVTAALQSGTAKPADLARAVSRMVRQILYFKMGQNVTQPADATEIDRAAGADVATKAEEEGIVLLNNTGKLLPLAKSVHSIAVLGAFADLPPARPNGSGFGYFLHYTSELAGLRAAAPVGTTIDLIQANTLDPANTTTVSGWQGSYFSAPNFQGTPVTQRTDSMINFDWTVTAEPGCTGAPSCGSAV